MINVARGGEATDAGDLSGTQQRLDGESKLKAGDRVAATATIELLADRDDRVLITARFEGSPTPIVIDSVWSNCAACDLQVGGVVRLEGKLERINHGGNPRWDTASIVFDGLNHGVALPLGEIEPA